jgi:hypothetical protein
MRLPVRRTCGRANWGLLMTTVQSRSPMGAVYLGFLNDGRVGSDSDAFDVGSPLLYPPIVYTLTGGAGGSTDLWAVLAQNSAQPVFYVPVDHIWGALHRTTAHHTGATLADLHLLRAHRPRFHLDRQS